MIPIAVGGCNTAGAGRLRSWYDGAEGARFCGCAGVKLFEAIAGCWAVDSTTGAFVRITIFSCRWIMVEFLQAALTIKEIAINATADPTTIPITAPVEDASPVVDCLYEYAAN